MKRKPENHGDLMRTVLAVRTIGLLSARYLPKHKLLLLTIAANSNELGKGRPIVYRAFTEVLEVQDWRTVRGILEQLTEIGLITKPVKTKAPGKSNGFMYSWDLRLEHPAYPDGYANSPCKKPPENAASIQSSTCKEPGENAPSEGSSPCKPQGLNLQAEQVEPASFEVSTCKILRKNADNELPTNTSTNNQPTPQSGWWEPFEKTIGHASDKIRPRLEAIGKEFGPLHAKGILRAWKNRPETLVGLKHPWEIFVREHASYVDQGRERQHEGMSYDEQLAADPAMAKYIGQQEQAIRASWLPGEKRTYQEVLDAIVAETYVAPPAQPVRDEEAEGRAEIAFLFGEGAAQ